MSSRTSVFVTLKNGFTKAVLVFVAIALACLQVSFAGVSAAFAAAADGSTVVLAGSDFEGYSNDVSGENVTAILGAMQNSGISSPDALLFAGDYNVDYNNMTAAKANAGIAALKTAISNVYPSLTNISLIRGEKEYASSGSISTTSSGAHDASTYGVFLINEDDFPWTGGNSPAAKTAAQTTASNLMSYLNGKISQGYTKPIFVVSHLPIHANADANANKYGAYLFNVMNQAANAGLNIVFLYGHAHDGASDAYLGGSAVFYQPGDEMVLFDPSNTANTITKTIGFTALNAGYTGYYGSNTSTQLTMSAITFNDSSMTFARYNQNGRVALKNAGSAAGGFAANGETYASPTTVALNTTVNTKGAVSSYTSDSSIAVTGVTISQDSLSLVYDNDKYKTAKLTADVQPATASNTAVRWSSSNTSVATVDADGNVTAKAAGTATITATTVSGSKTAKCTVTVIKSANMVAVSSIRMSESSLTMYVGENHQLSTTVTPADAMDKSVTWKSGNKSLASIDENGVVTALAPGNLFVTATSSNGKICMCTISIKSRAVEGIQLNTNTLNVAVGTTGQLVATVTPENASNKNVTWTIDNPRVATISEDGLVTGVADGTTTAHAVTEEGNFKASCNVIVKTQGIFVTPSTLVLPKGQSYTYTGNLVPEGTAGTIQWACYHAGTINASTGVFQATGAGEQTTIYAKTTDGKYPAPINDATVTVADQSSINWSIADGVLTVGTNVGNYASADKAPWAPYADQVSSIVIKDNVTSIGNYAFASCTGATNLTIPKSVKTIGAAAFSGCAAMKGFIDLRPVSYKADSFAGCKNLTMRTLDSCVLDMRTLSTAGVVHMNYYIAIPDSVRNTDGARLVVYDENGRQKSSFNLTSLGKAGTADDGTPLYRFTYSNPAPKIDAKFTIKIEDIHSNNMQLLANDVDYSAGYTSSIADMCRVVLDEPTASAGLKKLCRAMLLYGDAAQKYLGYDVTNIANGIVDTDLTRVVAADLELNEGSSKGSVTGIDFVGCSLLLNENTTLRMYFKLKSGYSISDYNFSVYGRYETAVKSGTMYYVDLTDVAAQDLDRADPLVVSRNKESATFSYSPLSYAYMAINQGSSNPKLKRLGQALYLYGASADAYFN